MKNRSAVVLLAAAVFLCAAQAVHAGLFAVGPTSPATGYFPVWYQDKEINGLQLELCLSQTVSPNVPPTVPPSTFMCTLLPTPEFDPNLPIVFPLNWSDENFWFTGDASITTPGGLNMDLITAVEAAFSTGPVINGDQVSFARVRLRIDLPENGTYTVTHPYGSKTFANVGPGTRAINDTVDIGIGAPGIFTGALGGPIGPFLQAADAPGGNPTPTAVGSETFIGDPNIPGGQFVMGSPFGTNFFRVEGPGIGKNPPCPGAPAPDNCVQTDLFFVSGKVFGGFLPTDVNVDRSTYSRTTLGDSKIDVFSTSPVAATLSFRDTLVPGTDCVAMLGDGTGKFHGRQSNTAIDPPPPYVIVTAADPPSTPTQIANRAVDVVKIATAVYALDSKTLVIEATSSDKFNPPPTLTAVGFGALDPGIVHRFEFPLGTGAQPPARITVKSTQGGSDTEPVQIVPTVNRAPVAVNDAATTTQGAPVNIDVLANDSDPDGNLPLTVANLTTPAHGTAAPGPNNTVTYTPAGGFFGSDSFTYQAQDSLGAFSNVATVTVTVQASNQPPVAVNDAATTGVGSAVNIAVLANDSDPDNNLPLTVANLTPPANGTTAPGPNNTVTYTPNAGFSGSDSFTYQAQDSLGALSNVAAVTVTVNRPPVAVNDSATTRVGTSVNIAVLANDSDPDNNLPLTVANLSTPANGTAVLQANNTVTYTPNIGFSGSDSFTYQARDSIGALSTAATVTVTVTPETITATAQARVRNGRAEWTINGTTNVINGNLGANVMTVRLNSTGALIGNATPDNRGRWKLSIRNSLVVPGANDQIAVTSRYTTTPRLFPVTVR